MNPSTRNPKARRPAGFTVLEILAVVAVIAILAALTIGGMSFAAGKQARESAKVQVNLLAMALEDYRADQGEYPVATAGEPIRAVHRALHPPQAGEKIYLAELDPANDSIGWLNQAAAAPQGMLIFDPWGQPYRYRSGSRAAGPGFDLWSMGPDGVSEAPNGSYDPEHPDNLDDIRSW